MTTSVSRQTTRFGILAATIVAIATALTACTSVPTGDAARYQGIHDSCPTDQLVNAKVLTDVSGTSVSDEIIAERLDQIRTVAERVAVCGGFLEVSAFAGNSVPVSLYSGDVTVPGATDLARFRRVPDEVQKIVDAVSAAYRPAVSAVLAGGTDVTGVYRLLGESQTLHPTMRLEGTILTDGATNQGVLIDHALSADEAKALADQVSVPDLSGASVSVIGIGRVAGDPLPSDFIEGLKAFYTRLCQNTKADSCLVTTDGE